MSEEEKTTVAYELLEQGAKRQGATLTAEQCQLLLDYLQERFDDGYGCGCNTASYQ